MDGNCYYRAISCAMDETENNHLKWRDLICREAAAHPEKFRQYVDGTVEEHLMRVRQPREWAQTIDMYATAHLLQKNMYVLSPIPGKEGDGSQYRWLKISAPVGGGAPRCEFKSSSHSTKHDYITLCHTHGNHFDLVVPVNGCNCDLPPPSFAAASQTAPEVV